MNIEKNTCPSNWKSSTSCTKRDFERTERESINLLLTLDYKVARKPMINYSRDLLFKLSLSNCNNNDSSSRKPVGYNLITKPLTSVEDADDLSSR